MNLRRTPFLQATLLSLSLIGLTVGFSLIPSVSCAEEQPARALVADAAEHRDWQSVRNPPSGARWDAQSDGMTALHWAVHHQHLAAVKSLLETDAIDVDAETEYEVTPLTIACELGHPEIVEQLLSAGADVEQSLPGGVTPLLLAARSGNHDVIQSLLDHGSSIDEEERNGQTALMWAAAAGHAQAAKTLLKAGADADEQTKIGFTPLMFAARQGHLSVTEVFVEAGIHIDTVMNPSSKAKRTPRKGTSALTLAVESGHFELAMYLVHNGADPNDQRSGFAPLHAISWTRRPARGEEPDGDPPPRGSGTMNSLTFVRELVKSGADVNLRLQDGKKRKAHLNRKGATPFLFAAKTADLPLMKLLVELGADPTIANADECTPLMAAAGIGVRSVGEDPGTEEEVIQAMAFLLEHGNEINAVDKNKETAMHGAGYRCFPGVVKFLAENGTDPATWNHKNVSGWTPVMIAKGHRPGSFKPHPETVAAIEELIRGSR